MDDQNVVTTTTTDATPDVEQTETVKTEPVKNDKADNAEIEKLKRLLSKANSEAASYKQQLRDKQTEQERAEAERADAERAKDERLAELERVVEVGDCINRALSIGFDAENGEKFANAWYDRDKEATFDSLNAFVEATKTRLENEALNRQPTLSAGVPPTKNTTTDADMEQMRRWMGVPVRR